MALIDIKINPTKTDLRVFAALWVAFFALLGFLALGRPSALFSAGLVTGTCFLISLAFNRDYPRRAQWPGLLIPLALLTMGGVERFLGVDPWIVSGIVWAIGGFFGLMMLASPTLARGLYRGWMFAALPIGWTISHLILALVYYLVVTPIGLMLRLAGNDPMQRRFDRGATTYWIPRDGPSEPSRYFKQF